jgi:adenine-specific DNA methylase
MGANPGYGGVRFYADHPSINSTEIFSVGNTDGNVRVANSIYATAFIYNSDRTLKQDIVPLDKSLDKVRALQGYTFTWIKDGRADVGVIAQEVENIYPELVHTDVTTGLKSVEYGNLVAPLIEAVKELANAFDALATRVFNTESRQTELEKQNEIQAQQIAELQRQINLLQAK